MTEDPVERLAERIEADGDQGHDAAAALRFLYENGQGIHALPLAAYIERLEQQIDQLGAIWSQETGASPQ